MTKLLRLTTMALTLATATGCAVGPDYSAPTQVADIQLEASYKQAELATTWWQTFDDKELSRIVALALAQNRNLAKAAANVERAYAIFADADNDGLPKGSLDAGYQASKNGTLSTLDNNGVSRGSTLGANLSWDIDLFGKIRRATEAAAANAQQAEALLHDAQVQIISQVANSYGDFRSAQMRLRVAEQNLANLEQTRSIVQARLDTGFASDIDLARIDTQYFAVKATLPGFQADLLGAQASLSALLGLAPGQLILADSSSLPQLIHPVSIKNSEDYLRYRADVAGAERQLAASTADIGVRTAELYPAISIQGFLGFVSAPGLNLNGSTKGWSVAPGLSWQAGDLGSVKARIRAANASAKMALADFEQQVLKALNEIQLSLDEYNLSRQQQLLSEQQYKASTKAMILARVRYEAGSEEFYALLDTEREWLKSRDQLTQIQQMSFSKLVSIYRVFAGSLVIQAQEV